MSDSNEPSGAIVPEAPEEVSSEPEILPSGPRVDGLPVGRDAESGRFLPGNRLGHGSPLAGKAAKLRQHCSRRLVGTTLRRFYGH